MTAPSAQCRKLLLRLGLAALAGGGCAPLPPPPAPPAGSEIARDLGYLADPARQGRQLGTSGRDSAALWIAERLEAAGVRPVYVRPCQERHPCPPGLWGDAFQLPTWSLSGTAVNVAGIVPGSDPALRDHVIVVGAHYDHIGRLSEYSRDPASVGIRPGADDNASGTAALLELARRVAARPAPASVLFVAFDAEELGLFGSRHFLEEPPVPVDRIGAMLNFDMVGRMRGGRLTVRNVGSADWWPDALADANADSLRLDFEHGGGASDHVSFREVGIPAIHFYTGTHADYHRRSDREERINYLGILQVVDLAERLLRSLTAHLEGGAVQVGTPAADTASSRVAAGIAAGVAAPIEALAARLAADVAADGVGALAAAVVVGDSVVWAQAYGDLDAAGDRPATPESLFRIGSLTKMFTAAALMRLVERGVVGLEEPVAVRVPEIAGLAGFQARDRPITYRDLASHTAGLEREPSSSNSARGGRSAWARKTLASIPLTEMRSSPGEAYRYSNIGYALLGLALERAAGRPFDRLVAEEVLRPLGLEGTRFHVPRRHRQRLATGYVNAGDGAADPRVPRAEHRGRGYKVPSEGLYSTVGDLARLVMALSGSLDDALLGDPARAAMLADHTPGGDPRSGYGLGLQLTRIGGTLLAGHSGTAAGYTSYLVFDPASRIGVVLLRSYNRGATNLAAEAQGLVLDLAAVAGGGAPTH